MRGNLSHPFSPTAELRSIPACAGEPDAISRSEPASWVYPRVCGGTQRQDNRVLSTRGLSPRVRGNRFSATAVTVAAGSIPACAGEPQGGPTPSANSLVYPRVCGGTQIMEDGRDPEQGLSPRVRGNPETEIAEYAEARSIPACAGEPTRRCPHGQSHWVYPRVCGGTSNRPRYVG